MSNLPSIEVHFLTHTVHRMCLLFFVTRLIASFCFHPYPLENRTCQLQTPKIPPTTPVRRAFFCTSCDSSGNVSSEEGSAKKLKKSNTVSDIQSLDPTKDTESLTHLERSVGERAGSLTNNCLTSTPACVPFRSCHNVLFTPENQERKSMSPITRSTQHMCRAMQVSVQLKVTACKCLLMCCVAF